MKDLPCFVCGISTRIYCKDITSLRSKHSETKILTYLEKFVGQDLATYLQHKTNPESSVVCQNCIIKIDEYDELYTNAMILEDELRAILLTKLENQRDVDADVEFVEQNDTVMETVNAEDVCDETVDEATVVNKPSRPPSMFCNICKRNFNR